MPLNSSKMVVIANQINEARYRMPTSEQKLFLYLVSQINETDPKQSVIVKFSINDFCKYLNIDRNRTYDRIREAVKMLPKRTICFDDAEGNFHAMPLIIRATVMADMQNAEIVLNNELTPYLLQLKKNFTRYHLKHVINLKSHYSIRIYQILKQHEYRKTVEYDIHKLRFCLDIEEGEYKKYGDFKINVLTKAQKEIKEKTDIRFEYKELKQGKKVIGLVFSIFPQGKEDLQLDVKVNKVVSVQYKDQPLASEPTQTDVQSYLVKTFQDLGILSEMTKSWIESYGLDYLKQKLDYALAEQKMGKVKNLVGYLIKAITNDYGTSPDAIAKAQQSLETLNQLQAQHEQAELERQKQQAHRLAEIERLQQEEVEAERKAEQRRQDAQILTWIAQNYQEYTELVQEVYETLPVIMKQSIQKQIKASKQALPEILTYNKPILGGHKVKEAILTRIKNDT